MGAGLKMRDSHTCKIPLLSDITIGHPLIISFRITGIQEDQAKLTTHLTAQIAQWSEVGGTYDLDFGSTPSKEPSADRRRGLIDGLLGNFDENPSVTFPLNIGTPGKKTSIISSNKWGLFHSLIFKIS